MNSKFKIGDIISKCKGYAFDGVVVSVFTNTKGQIRIVAEHTGSQTEESGGMLHIFSESQLVKNDTESENKRILKRR